MSELSPDLRQEQDRLDVVYSRLDELRASTRERLASVRRAGPSGSPQNRSERDSFATLYEDRISLLDAVEDRLVFGRLDFDEDAPHNAAGTADEQVSGTTRYVGRIGLSDQDQVNLLTDWRAPAAQSFYRATAAQRDGVKRRRHLQTRDRKVTGVEDEILDLSLTEEQRAELNLSGEGALLSAMSAGRTGKMNDIVSTIQREQDEIIRTELQGALVVQGGPGTGKTAVALHRAAYLLYAHRKLLERSGVLLVGPSPSFLRYIDQVLPSLGETGVVSTTLASILPNVTATHRDTPDAAFLKGNVNFATVIQNAVRARERVPAHDIELRIDGHDLVIRRRDIKDAMYKARRHGKPHNVARKTFVKEMLHRLAQQYVNDMPYEVAPEDRSEITEEIRSNRDVRVALNLAWFPISATKLVEDLFAKPHRLAQAAPHLNAQELKALYRSPGSPWTTSDIALLDEAYELLGETDDAQRAEERARESARTEALEYARQVLESSNTGGIRVDAETLAQRFVDSGPVLTTAERAAKDRTWTYAHVIVDEAQELTAMDWRMLIRRCPTRSFTIVGDVAQTSNPAGARSWGRMLSPLFTQNWSLKKLTINYRTPREIASSALSFAKAHRLPVSELTSARSLENSLVSQSVAPDELLSTAASETLRAVENFVEGGAGRVAVVAASARLETLRTEISKRNAAQLHGSDPIVSVIDPHEAKGLEYDAVILVEPSEIVSHVNGVSDLFVAMTRATKRLSIVHCAALPRGLEVE